MILKGTKQKHSGKKNKNKAFHQEKSVFIKMRMLIKKPGY
ncbi:hypothetical protein HMPREF0880_03146 [Yokenella regensburgei ATCC 43003]|jgi:hypothetical protein|nr:hypothetical protein HMPREF0880_03146 [Yokenella regensburgei ATCC 43003]